jgi:hypothetical protein
MITILLLIGLVLYVTIGSVKLLKQINRINDMLDKKVDKPENNDTTGGI